MRLFVGVPLSTVVMDELSAVSWRLRAHGDGLRWTAPETWHMTLQFLGNADAKQCECVVERLRAVHQSPMAIRLENVSCFDRVGIIYAGVEVTQELITLQAAVTVATKDCGFIAEERPYRPHITLARSKEKAFFRGIKSKVTMPSKFFGFMAQEFLLYESFLGAGGSRYEVRAQFPLKKANSTVQFE